jgi:hypothetical protein
MSEMVERVARAIFECEKWEFASSDPYDEQPDGMKETFRGVARAAIAAMREPTEGTLAAWVNVGIDQDP